MYVCMYVALLTHHLSPCCDSEVRESETDYAQYAVWNKKVLSLDLKVVVLDTALMSLGRRFHTDADAQLKALSAITLLVVRLVSFS